MMRALLIALLVFPALAVASESGERVIENDQIGLKVWRRGAIISDLGLKGGHGDWLAAPAPKYRGMFAHFLCFDRWGRPSKADQERGIPFHGEAVQQVWAVKSENSREQALGVTLPVAKLSAERTLRLAEHSPVFEITTTFHNPTGQKRPYNAVEHITLSAQGYAEATRVSTNATRGFVQWNGRRVPDSTFTWPMATVKAATWDLRKWVRVEGMLITSLIFEDDEEWGWVCVENTESGEMLGYVWPVEDFPWLMLWTNYKRGRVVDRAIEPGTSGLNLPLDALVEAKPMLGRSQVRFLKPDEARTHRIRGFVLKRPEGAGGEVSRVSVVGDQLRIEWGLTGVSLELPVK